MKTLKLNLLLISTLSILTFAGCDNDVNEKKAVLREFMAACEGAATTTITVGSINTVSVSCVEPKTTGITQ